MTYTLNLALPYIYRHINKGDCAKFFEERYSDFINVIHTKPNRVRIGEEFCSRRLLLLSHSNINDLIKACNNLDIPNIDFVFPVVFQEEELKALELVDYLLNKTQISRLVLNSYGFITKVRSKYPKARIVLGRMLPIYNLSPCKYSSLNSLNEVIDHKTQIMKQLGCVGGEINYMANENMDYEIACPRCRRRCLCTASGCVVAGGWHQRH